MLEAITQKVNRSAVRHPNGEKVAGSFADRPLGSSPGDEILDFSLLFFDFGFCRRIDFLRGMVE